MNTYFKNVLIICNFKVRMSIMFLLDSVEKILIYEHSNEFKATEQYVLVELF